MDEFHRAGLTLQHPAELNQTDEFRIEVTTALGEHVFRARALPRLSVGLLCQQPGVDKLL
jgi:hypothetical protein